MAGMVLTAPRPDQTLFEPRVGLNMAFIRLDPIFKLRKNDFQVKQKNPNPQKGG
jgi:hypothetical protein